MVLLLSWSTASTVTPTPLVVSKTLLPCMLSITIPLSGARALTATSTIESRFCRIWDTTSPFWAAPPTRSFFQVTWRIILVTLVTESSWDFRRSLSIITSQLVRFGLVFEELVAVWIVDSRIVLFEFSFGLLHYSHDEAYWQYLQFLHQQS